MREDYELDKLPEPYRTIAEITDIKTAVLIAKHFGGEQLYFPKFETVERPFIRMAILSEFNGYNYRHLARKYNLTERTVRRICSGIADELRNAPIDGQISFDDF